MPVLKIYAGSEAQCYLPGRYCMVPVLVSVLTPENTARFSPRQTLSSGTGTDKRKAIIMVPVSKLIREKLPILH